MTLDLITSASSAPAAEVLSQIVEGILEILVCAKDVLIERESFLQLSGYLERILPVLKELIRNGINHPDSLTNAIDVLNGAIKAAKQLTAECRNKSKVYLLINCKAIVKRLEETTKEISRALSLIPLASLDLSSVIIHEIGELSDIMQEAEFKAAVAEEEILEKIELGIQERNVDRSYANKLLVLIAESVGISTERSSLKKEFEEFRSEIENARLRKDQAEAIQMDQIIALLERADAASSPEEKEAKYFIKRNSLGTQPLEPLQSFYCPITREVMEDPVETSSGQTFERSAIEKWFAHGNKLCPMTQTPLDTSTLRPNKTLRLSIQEWKDRNTMIMIAHMKTKLQSGVEEEVLHCLEWLQNLCEQRDLHREWVVLENYIPILIEQLVARNRDIRNLALVILHVLVKDSDGAKERVAKVDNAIELIVHSLGRRAGERKLAVTLLNELTKNHIVRNSIGKVHGCILLLVTMSSSDDSEAARCAKELLEKVAFSDQNAIQMAKANYFEHLLHRLSSGPEDVRMIMARTLAEMELTDHNKSSLFEDGVLESLLHLVLNGDINTKQVAVEALRNLSSLPANGLRMIREGAVRTLLDLLYPYTASSTRLREHVAATLMQLAVSTVSQETGGTPVSMLESSEDISKLFSLINLTEPNVKTSILCTFIALCQSRSAANMKTELSQCSLQVLVQLFLFDNLSVRTNAIKLFSFLVEDGDEAMILEHVGQKCIETLTKIIKSSHDKEEAAYAMGILSHLPEDPQITQWLYDSNAPSVIFSYLHVGSQRGPHKDQLIENAVGAMCRLTVPTNQALQKKAAEIGTIPILVRLLELGTTLTKIRAAISLAQFSRSSLSLSRPIPRRGGFLCFSAPPEPRCAIHLGICTIESSFCLVEANAVGPLVRVLGDSDPGACEASLDALLTLVEGERLQSGSKVLTDAGAIPQIIRLLSSPSSGLVEKVLDALERIFRLIDIKQMYGDSAQMPLVDITQRGSSRMKSLAARILGHLNVLHEQSSYF